MSYTIEDNDKINAQIQSDVDLIVCKILELLEGKVHSILLCGGFGRGEGSVVVRNNQIKIVNDYDFTIVLNAKNRLHYIKLYKKFHDPLEKLAVQLALKLDIKQIDLGLKPLFYFTNAKILRIENYETKKGHMLVFGDENPTHKMPAWRAEDIPIFEGTWLFRNRGLGMMIAALYFLNKNGIPKDKKDNFVIEVSKAQIAMGDSILLLRGKYHHLYNERLRRADNIDITGIPDGDKILDGYKEALKQKLHPDFEKYYQRDLTEWWFNITQIMDSFYRYFEGKRLNVHFGNWYDYVSLPKPEDKFEMKTFIGITLRKRAFFFSVNRMLDNYRKSRRSYSIVLVALLLFSLGKRKIKKRLIEKAALLLGRPISEATQQVWIDLAIRVLDEIHPGGEVAKTINLHRGYGK